MPKPVQVVIWDEMGSQFLIQALEPKSYHILKVRKFAIYLHPLIVWRTVIGVLTRRNTHYGIVIEYCKPKTVITFIDNDSRFHRLASSFPDTSFDAIQNGVRAPVHSEAARYLGPQTKYDSNQWCWGQNEIESYEALGYRFKKVTAVGSLRNHFFYRTIQDSKDSRFSGESFDVVLISQFRHQILESHPMQAYVEYEKLVCALASYLSAHDGLRACVAMVTDTGNPDHGQEKRFHNLRLGDLVTLIPKSEELMSGYLLTEQSDVVVSSSSALGFESLARGRKTLMCSRLYSDIFVDQTFSPDWTLFSMDQEIFDKAMTNLLAMSRENFVSRNSESTNYFMIPAHENSMSTLIRDLLD
jgi:surface carbohydrate biosynthesis protein